MEKPPFSGFPIVFLWFSHGLSYGFPVVLSFSSQTSSPFHPFPAASPRPWFLSRHEGLQLGLSISLARTGCADLTEAALQKRGDHHVSWWFNGDFMGFDGIIYAWWFGTWLFLVPCNWESSLTFISFRGVGIPPTSGWLHRVNRLKASNFSIVTNKNGVVCSGERGGSL